MNITLGGQHEPHLCEGGMKLTYGEGSMNYTLVKAVMTLHR